MNIVVTIRNVTIVVLVSEYRLKFLCLEVNFVEGKSKNVNNTKFKHTCKINGWYLFTLLTNKVLDKSNSLKAAKEVLVGLAILCENKVSTIIHITKPGLKLE